MTLARDFKSSSDKANRITLNWKAPIGFNDTTNELILTKSISHFAMELYNTSFPTKATDSRPIEIFRGRTIVGTNTGTISVSSNTITDTSATFPTSPSLKGRYLRDANSQVFLITSNTTTSITVELGTKTLTNGKYIVLVDFVTETRVQENYELDIRTTAGVGFIQNLTTIQSGVITLKEFTEDEVANLIFIDGAGTKFLIRSNTSSKITLFESAVTPVIGSGMAILNSFVNSTPSPYLDNFLTIEEADNRTGTGLRDNKYYYYTMFTKPVNTNVAQAKFGLKDSGDSTQDFAISTADKQFGERLFDYWPGIVKQLDDTGDMEDLMQVFGFFFNELHALIDTYKLQDTNNIVVNGLLPLSEQTGLPSVGFSIGIDTLRRIAKDMISCWKLKGSKQGIATFIRKITTWDITNGTGDFSAAVQDTIPNLSAFRFFDVNLGLANTRYTTSSPLYNAGGRFAKGLPGVVIPGFFSFREFVITLTDVALYTGSSTLFVVEQNNTTMTDDTANFGADNSLVGNFLLSNQAEVNDVFEIISNTTTTITVKGIITNRDIGGFYAVLSPLNTNRFIILNKLLPFYIPFKTAAGFIFVS